MALSAKELKGKSVEFRIGAIGSDGMYWDKVKWRKKAGVTEEEIDAWIEDALDSGLIVQSETGARSYRFPLHSIRRWYLDNGFDLDSKNDQLLDFIFPPRIWDGKTEMEGFLDAPRRELGVVTFTCSPKTVRKIIKRLLGLAKVKEISPGKFKAYSLSVAATKGIIEEEIKEAGEYNRRAVYSRGEAHMRELVDFSDEFAQNLIIFYRKFGKNVIRNKKETIKFFLPEEEDQEAQLLVWIIQAIEKYDEKKSVPFPGYLDNVMEFWTRDLPQDFLGKELNSFRKERAKAVKELLDEGVDNPTSSEILEQMGLSKVEFSDMEERMLQWLRAQNPETLTWDDSSDEKIPRQEVMPSPEGSNIDLANRISVAVIRAALETGFYDEAFHVIDQMDKTEIDSARIREMPEEFIESLERNLRG